MSKSMAGDAIDVDAIRVSSKKSWRLAVEFLSQAVQDGQQLDLRMVGPVLSACARAQQWQQAMALLKLTKSPGPIAFNSLANACERAGNWQQSIAVLVRMGLMQLELDSFSFCTMMGALASGQKWREAIRLQQQLTKQSVQQNTILRTAAINACAKGDGQWRMAIELLGMMADDSLERSTVTYSSVISACERAGEWTVALGLLEDMQQTEVALDIIVFSAAISACEKAGQWTTAFDLFHKMQRQIVQVDAISVSAVISACEKAAQWEAAIDFLHHSLTSLRLPSNSVSFAAAISACEKAGEWTAACALLKSLQTSGVDMDAFPFSATISACSRAGQWQVALHILSQMKWHQVFPDTVSYTAAISACANSSSWTCALELLGALSAEGLRADEFACSAAMSACEVTGKWEAALGLLCSMLDVHLPVDGIHVGSVVGARQRVEGEMAAIELLKALCKGGRLWMEAEDSDEATADLKGLEVLRDVDGLVVLSKASGVLTEDALTRVRDRVGTKVTCISRLDAPTSGVLPLALGGERSPSTRWFKAQFAGHLAKKEYLCLCHGRCLDEAVKSEQCISFPLGVTEGIQARAVCDPLGREAITLYKVLEQYTLPQQPTGNLYYCLVKAKPHTGRMHQIRVHMASIGHPLVGDRQYGLQLVPWCQRLFLHCLRLELLDWSTEQKVHVESPLPTELEAVLEYLASHSPGVKGRG